MSALVRPVVLSGGAGTRLWPLSTKERPKQFLPLLGEPLLAATVDRLQGLAGLGSAIVITGRPHLPLVEEVLSGSRVPVGTTLVEPAGRNTGPAVLAAALVSDPETTLVVLPSDHHIRDVAGFRRAVEDAVALAGDGLLVTFGVPPTRPETGYGYLEVGAPVGGGFRVARFKEKPGSSEAMVMAADGRHLWNSGMFVFKAGTILAEAGKHSPRLLAAVEPAVPGRVDRVTMLGDGFAEAPSISIDHAVMERTEQAAVIPIDVGWSDIGSWQSLWEVSPRDEQGNVVVGDVIHHRVTNSYLLSTTRRLAVAGIDGLTVVETPEAVLVVPLHRSQLVRGLADEAGRDRPG